MALHISTTHDLHKISIHVHLRVAPTQGKRFPQAKLNRENNVCFIFNKYGDLYCKIIGVQIILFKLKT